MNDADRFARRSRRLLLAWLALLALMLASLGSAYLPLGPWNAVAGLGIATIKSAIVLWAFMHLGRGGPQPRVAAAAGLFVLALLIGLSELDELTRSTESAVMQPPQQLRPLRQGGSVR